MCLVGLCCSVCVGDVAWCVVSGCGWCLFGKEVNIAVGVERLGKKGKKGAKGYRGINLIRTTDDYMCLATAVQRMRFILSSSCLRRRVMVLP